MKKLAYLALGCDKNRVDTERMLAALHTAGFEIVPAPAPADVLVINTCGFIDAAKEESVEAIMAGVGAREDGDYKLVAVVGCLVELFKEELSAEVPEVDIWMGLEHVGELARCISDVLGETAAGNAGLEKHIEPDSRIVLPRHICTPSHYAFLKIADGCNSACSFCVIPRIRGPLCSVPLAALVDEAAALGDAGVKELVLVAQETTAYGHDLGPPLELADLIEALLAGTSLPWLRVLYAHPEHMTDRLIDLLASEERLLRYLDLPLQHINDRILAAMGRRPGSEGITDLVERLQAKVPGLALRTTFLAGYPGETDKEFQELLDFMERAKFFWASGFVFSPQEGTPAKNASGQVEPEIADERLGELFEVQRAITAEHLSGLVGQTLDVLVDDEWESESNEALIVEVGEGNRDRARRGTEKIWKGRFRGQAVDVDGVVKLVGDARPGEIVKARVIEAWDYDLVAQVLRCAGEGTRAP